MVVWSESDAELSAAPVRPGPPCSFLYVDGAVLFETVSAPLMARGPIRQPGLAQWGVGTVAAHAGLQLPVSRPRSPAEFESTLQVPDPGFHESPAYSPRLACSL